MRSSSWMMTARVYVCDAAAVITAQATPRAAVRRRVLLRWSVHVLLIATVVASLALEPVLMLHVTLGLVFVSLVAAHLLQRRHTSVALLRRLARPGGLYRRGGRMAVADAVLLVLTAGMLASGLWDWIQGHPTRIRWHALTGVALAVYLLAHTLRRRSRLRRSQIR